MKNKKMILVLVILLLGTFIIGCSSSDDKLDVYEPAHGLKVEVNIPDDLTADISTLKIEDHIEIQKAEIKLYNEDKKIDSGTLDDFSEDNIILFDEVQSGKKYKVKAELIGTIRNETDNKVLYKGEKESPEIEADSITEIDVNADPLNAKSLEVNIDIDSGIDVEKITLKRGSEILKESENDSLFFEKDNGLTPTNYNLSIELSDREELTKRDILLLPTEEKVIDLEIDGKTGEIKTGIDVYESPNTPKNSRIENEKLIWDEGDNIDEYVIYKSEDGEDFRHLTVVGTNEYNDIKENYFYKIRAYNEEGYSSALSNSIGVKSNKIIFDVHGVTLRGDESGSNYQLPTEGLQIIGVLHADDGETYYTKPTDIENNGTNTTISEDISFKYKTQKELSDKELREELVEGTVKFHLKNKETGEISEELFYDDIGERDEMEATITQFHYGDSPIELDGEKIIESEEGFHDSSGSLVNEENNNLISVTFDFDNVLILGVYNGSTHLLPEDQELKVVALVTTDDDSGQFYTNPIDVVYEEDGESKLLDEIVMEDEDEISANGATITFHLKSGITGEIAEDYVYEHINLSSNEVYEENINMFSDGTTRTIIPDLYVAPEEDVYHEDGEDPPGN